MKERGGYVFIFMYTCLSSYIPVGANACVYKSVKARGICRLSYTQRQGLTLNWEQMYSATFGGQKFQEFPCLFFPISGIIDKPTYMSLGIKLRSSSLCCQYFTTYISSLALRMHLQP